MAPAQRSGLGLGSHACLLLASPACPTLSSGGSPWRSSPGRPLPFLFLCLQGHIHSPLCPRCSSFSPAPPPRPASPHCSSSLRSFPGRVPTARGLRGPAGPGFSLAPKEGEQGRCGQSFVRHPLSAKPSFPVPVLREGDSGFISPQPRPSPPDKGLRGGEVLESCSPLITVSAASLPPGAGRGGGHGGSCCLIIMRPHVAVRDRTSLCELRMGARPPDPSQPPPAHPAFKSSPATPPPPPGPAALASLLLPSSSGSR